MERAGGLAGRLPLFHDLAKTDAVNAGRPHAWGGWIGIWLGCWLAAFAIEMVLIRAGEGALGNKLVHRRARAFCDDGYFVARRFVIGTAWSEQPHALDFHRGRLGTILFFNVWALPGDARSG